MLGKTSQYSIDVSGNDRRILLFYKKCHFCHLLVVCLYGFHGPWNKPGKSWKNKFIWKVMDNEKKISQIHGNSWNWLWVWAACGYSSLPAFCVVFVRCLNAATHTKMVLVWSWKKTKNGSWKVMEFDSQISVKTLVLSPCDAFDLICDMTGLAVFQTLIHL